VVAVQEGRDHFHVIAPIAQPPLYVEQDPDEPGQIQTREGTYSVVRYSPDDFEWDGWVTHD